MVDRHATAVPSPRRIQLALWGLGMTRDEYQKIVNAEYAGRVDALYGGATGEAITEAGRRAARDEAAAILLAKPPVRDGDEDWPRGLLGPGNSVIPRHDAETCEQQEYRGTAGHSYF